VRHTQHTGSPACPEVAVGTTQFNAASLKAATSTSTGHWKGAAERMPCHSKRGGDLPQLAEACRRALSSYRLT